MIANFLPNKIYTVSERFVTEKLLELLFNKTLDSHRAKLNSPRWIIIELLQVFNDWQRNKIKNFERTVRPLIHETLKLIDNDDTIDFTPLEKSYFNTLLNQCTEKNFNLQLFACRTILDTNTNYIEKLFLKIFNEVENLNSKNVNPSDLSELSKYLDILASELINQGYSKGYLYTRVSRLFSDNNNLDFKTAFEEFATLKTKISESFIVVFRLRKLSGGPRKIAIKTSLELTAEQVEHLSKINEKTDSFFAKNDEFSYFIGIEIDGIDYLSVIENAKKELFTLIDLLHLGYPDNPFSFYQKCLVIGSKKPELTNIHPVSYVTDGNYKNNEKHYENLLEKTKSLTESKVVQKESIKKIVSAYRYLRLGRDADMIEQKFINYWIGLEYIFSNYDITETTITRMKEYFTHSHSIAYIKRNLQEFHNDIKRLKLGNAIPNFSEDLNYLKNSTTYQFIIDNFFTSFPLLAFRANKYYELINSTQNITNEIVKHRQNLDWHLTRAYRIRNEIVHDAAIHLNIESITGHLKYYLTYVLNAIIHYIDNAMKNQSESNISIDDFLLLQDLKYNSLSKSGFKLEDLIKENSITEVFSN